MPTLKSGSFSFRSNWYTVLNRKDVMISNFPIQSFITYIVDKRILKWSSFLLNALMSLIEIFLFDVYRLLFYTFMYVFYWTIIAVCIQSLCVMRAWMSFYKWFHCSFGLQFMGLCILIKCCPLNKFLFCILLI